MFQENKYPFLKIVFFVVVLLPLVIILSQCEYIKLYIFTSVCMTHASVLAA